MYTLKSIRAKNTDRGDGRYAEALISINNDQEAYIFVHWEAFVNRFSYSLSYTSPYDNMNAFWDRVDNVEYIEKFDLLEEARDSEFFDLYHMLDQTLYALAQGPSKPAVKQAKMLELITNASVEGSSKFKFSVTQPFEYGGEKYEATFYTEFYAKIGISLKRGDILLEQFEDLQDAGSSEWFMLYCRLKNDLINYIFRFRKENPEVDLHYPTVMWELLDDQLLNDLLDDRI